jgi:hypothetical protein
MYKRIVYPVIKVAGEANIHRLNPLQGGHALDSISAEGWVNFSRTKVAAEVRGPLCAEL